MDRFSDRLKETIGEKKQDPKERLQELFNDSAYSLIQEFMKNVKSGDIHIENTADLMRLMQIYKEVNEIENGGGDGRLPAMQKPERDLLDEFVETTVETTNEGEDEYYVDSDDLAELTEDDIEQLIGKRAETLNELNERSI